MRDFDLDGAREFFRAKTAFTTGVHEVLGAIGGGAADIVIVDLRLPSDFRAAHVPGAINLPKGTWATAQGLEKEKLNILYCYSQTCHMAAEAAQELLAKGYAVQEMEGGFATWQQAGYRVETSVADQAAA
jgi:rhodanese-related sulfurtransferase